MAIDIFNDEYKVQSALFNFAKVGDQLQGTYVGKSQAKSKYSGELEPLYEIMTEDGEFFTIWGKPIINQQMNRIKLGQIVGFKLIEERKTEKGNPAKIIQVFADPKLVNEEWMKENPDAGKQEEGVEVEDVDFGASEEPKKEAVPFESEAPPVGETPEAKEAQALALAQAKYGLADEQEIKNKVMNESGLAFIAPQMDAIIEFLQK